MENKMTQQELEGPKGWKIWKIIGRIDTQTAGAAYEKGEAIVKENAKTVIDMSEMDYLSSAGLRVLLRLSKLAQDNGGQFLVSGASGMVHTVLEDSGMDVLLNMIDSLDELE